MMGTLGTMIGLGPSNVTINDPFKYMSRKKILFKDIHKLSDVVVKP